MKRLFSWNITKDTAVGFITGFIMVALSFLMLPFSSGSLFDELMSVLLRDVCMIFGLGIVFVSVYCQKNGNAAWKDLGFSKDKIILSLILNIAFAVGLLFVFIKDGKPTNLLSIENLYGATYILVAGVFEMLFIYGFLRMIFEKSFGIIPAILLTSVFYSFHHAGFQPEFFHLFFVGIMYSAVFYITHNMLIVFPFFWAIGALWDVLVDSSCGNSIKNPFSFFVAIGIIVLSIIWYCIGKKIDFSRGTQCSPKQE